MNRVNTPYDSYGDRLDERIWRHISRMIHSTPTRTRVERRPLMRLWAKLECPVTDYITASGRTVGDVLND